MPDGSGGFEVISMVRRRRRWTAEQKVTLIEEVGRPGSSLAAVADRYGVSRSLLFEWRRQLREGTLPGVTAAAAAPAPKFAPVRLIADASATAVLPAPQSQPSAGQAQGAPSTVELLLRNGRVLRVAETIRPEVLARLAATLEA